MRDLVRKPGKGRAALCHGGIVWRLCRHLVDEGLVLRGSNLVVPQPGVVSIYETQEVTLWDDALTESDLHIIVGSYQDYRTGELTGQDAFLV